MKLLLYGINIGLLSECDNSRKGLLCWCGSRKKSMWDLLICSQDLCDHKIMVT
ncbi:hypothetical protein HanIR_Chr08g0348451 [Helianthus annuus]|nr:hypothetical protein HanIR_Chr08g0348451 [Helianthus annuus]